MLKVLTSEKVEFGYRKSRIRRHFSRQFLIKNYKKKLPDMNNVGSFFIFYCIINLSLYSFDAVVISII